MFRLYIHSNMGVFDFDSPPEIDGWTSKLVLTLFACILDVMAGDVALVHCKKMSEHMCVRCNAFLTEYGNYSIFGLCVKVANVERQCLVWHIHGKDPLTGKKFHIYDDTSNISHESYILYNRR